VLTSAAETQCGFECEQPMRRLMADLAGASMDAYRALIDAPDFWDWYRSVTPIEHIGRLPIASRPVSRNAAAGQSKFEDLRAIPWVFAWTQTRYNIPGWYGLGTALEKVLEHNPENHGLLRKMWEEWPFFHTLLENVQQELARSRMIIAAAYDRLSKVSLHERIAAEYTRTKSAVLSITGNKSLLAQHPAMERAIALRNPYTDVLNLVQIELLRRWSMMAEDHDREDLRQALYSSINGIAAAMQSTG
jgi:phosphoenolpyruvate carboxylase